MTKPAPIVKRGPGRPRLLRLSASKAQEMPASTPGDAGVAPAAAVVSLAKYRNAKKALQ